MLYEHPVSSMGDASVGSSKPRLLSVVLPVYNEAENIPQLVEEICKALDGTTPYEILLVDDASTDNSLDVIKQLAREDKRIRYLAFEQNCGQSAAIAAGFSHASGDAIATLDSDLQNDPADIPHMLPYLGEYQLVNGWRRIRRDNLWRRFGSRVGNGVRNWAIRETIHDSACGMKIIDADLARKLRPFRGFHRFIPALTRIEGGAVIEVPTNHRPRLHGRSNYSNLRRALEGLIDLFAVRWMQNKAIRPVIKEHHEP